MTEGRRGANRNEESRQAILLATAAQFTQRGWNRLTIEGIAVEAGVGKQTIYRWWPSKAALIADCLFEGILPPKPFIPPNTGDVRADLAGWLAEILAYAGDDHSAEFFRSLLAVAAEDPLVGSRLRDALAGDSALNLRLNQAVADGELAPDAPIREIGEALVGAAILRFIARGPIDPDLPARLVAAVLGGRSV